MQMNGMESATQWAVRTYGTVMLADQRRTQRAVKIARALARDPMGSLPAQLGNEAATKAAYRFLQSPPVTYERLMRPHVQQTLALMQPSRRVLLIQDMTEVDYQHHPKTSGLGPVGRNHHQAHGLRNEGALGMNWLLDHCRFPHVKKW
jgi:Transposase DNA-binding